MERFREVFKNKHVVLPVIHIEDLKQTISNIAVARESGADGVFLINHEISCEKLLDIYQLVSGKFPDFWIGINLLGMEPFEIFDTIFKKGLRVAGVWADNAWVDEFSEEHNQSEPGRIKRLILMNEWRGLYFGSIAFKYQPPAHNLEKIARIAARYMDVVTTSGPATGQAPDIKKIRRMRQEIPNKPLAIASGITPDNVSDYLEADCFLVATGISHDFYTLDGTKTERLVKKVRQRSH